MQPQQSGTDGGDLFKSDAQFFKRGGGVAHQQAAITGQSNGAVMTFEQTDAQGAFKALHRMADRAGGKAKLISCVPKRTQAAGGLKSAKTGQ